MITCDIDEDAFNEYLHRKADEEKHLVTFKIELQNTLMPFYKRINELTDDFNPFNVKYLYDSISQYIDNLTIYDVRLNKTEILNKLEYNLHYLENCINANDAVSKGRDNA